VSADPRLRRRDVLATVGVLLLAATDVLYVSLIIAQGNGWSARVVFVSAFIGLLAAAAAVGSRPGGSRTVLRAGALAGTFALGVLGLFSIGALLLVAGAFLAISESRRTEGRARERVLGALVALVVLAVGLVAT
jgi:hypothetical protein